MPEIQILEDPQVLFQSPRWLVLSKPAGWLTIPGRSTAENPESALVLSQWAEQEHGPIWTVHRLDRQTSGVVLFARSALDHRQAGIWFQERKMKKVYHFLAAGTPDAPLFKVQTPIHGAPSVTQFEVLETFGDYFLGQALPLTGRRHQIRIHLASKGHSILGDHEYGGIGGDVGATRVALHALKLSLPVKAKVFKTFFPCEFSMSQARRGR